ncbi:PREDICTED: putative FBD-associated F-box protein At5g56700 [Camelina sativa]|uniref:FBD-associated F-box protein At5g56700 n=1 Tax=Camelina sativa TaxID=90675 RepID=A0ABM1QLL6_CAMSA|nr:PREDICTED: putative FBD-associated F-box protein At5g56700 [Camelina sativa]
MANISNWSDELLIKILSYLPTKVAVSTSVLSKRWKFLWKWSPKLEFDDYPNTIGDFNLSKSSYLCQYFIYKILPFYGAPIIESLRVRVRLRTLQSKDFESWVGLAISRCARELSISYLPFYKEHEVLFPSSLFTCKSLVTLKLEGFKILVDAPRTVCLPSLKTLDLRHVRFLNQDCLRLLLQSCPVLEDLFIHRVGCDTLLGLVVHDPSLKRLSVHIDSTCSIGASIIVTPSLKYFNFEDSKVEDFYCKGFSYSIDHMPELEEANIVVLRNPQDLLESVTSSKRLSLRVAFNSTEKTVYREGIVFSQLEKLELFICNDDWSKLLVQLLKDSPNLQILSLIVDDVSFFVDLFYDGGGGDWIGMRVIDGKNEGLRLR